LIGWDKLPFAKHRVDEELIVDPAKRSADLVALSGERYEPVNRSEPLPPARVNAP
jgi:hypothetical protein